MAKQRINPNIQRAFDGVETQVMQGIIRGALLLTPSSVSRVTEDKHSTRKLGLLQPRCEFKFDPSVGSITLHSNIYRDSQTSKETAVGIHQGGLEFPHYCCECMKPAKRHDVVELSVLDRPDVAVNISGVSKEGLEKIAAAMHYNRYWYAVPFCDEHNLFSRAVGFQVADNKLVFKFANLEYGKQFGKQNDMETKWMDESVMKLKLLTNIGFISCLMCASMAVGLFAGGRMVIGTVLAIVGVILATSSLSFRLGWGRAAKVSVDEVESLAIAKTSAAVKDQDSAKRTTTIKAKSTTRGKSTSAGSGKASGSRKTTTSEHTKVSGHPSGEYCPQCRVMSGKMSQFVITERDVDMIKGTLKLECPECGHVTIKIP